MKEAKSSMENIEINKLIHEPARLKLFAQLYVIESADFTFLMNQTGLTQGNLSAHLAKLEDAGYLDIKKGYSGKRPQTLISINTKGRKEFKKYLEKISEIIGHIT